MNQKNLVEGRVGEWMQVSSGGKFFPADPRPEEIHIEDIANGLALTCRYGGQGSVDKFYTVAEHSLLLAEYAIRHTHWGGEVKKARFALVCLLHDAAEAYIGDLIKAVKREMRYPYGVMETRLQDMILKKYDVFEDSIRWHQHVKHLDTRIITNEKQALFEKAQGWATDAFSPLEDTHIYCFSPPVAKRLWLRMFFKLTDYIKAKSTFDSGEVRIRHS